MTSGYVHTWEDVGQALARCGDGVQISYSPEFGLVGNVAFLSENARKIRKNYGFVASDDIVSMLPELYAQFLENSAGKESFPSRVMNRLRNR